jgi:hypothetical protein
MARNKETKETMFFDSDGNEVGIDVIDRLDTGYPLSPEYNANGAKKKGELKVRFTKEQFNEEKRVTETVECPYEECELISERQDYEDGDAHTISIPKKHHSLVKLVRGQIG